MIAASYVALAALAMTATVDAAPFKLKIGRRFPVHADEIEARQAAVVPGSMSIQTAPNPTGTGVDMRIQTVPNPSGSSSSHKGRPTGKPFMPHYPPGLPICGSPEDLARKSSASLHPSGASGLPRASGLPGGSASASSGLPRASPLRETPDGKPILPRLADPIVGTPPAGGPPAASGAPSSGLPPQLPPGSFITSATAAHTTVSSHHAHPSGKPNHHPTCIPREIALKINYQSGSSSGLAKPTGVVGASGLPGHPVSGAPAASGAPGAPSPGGLGASPAVPGGPVASPGVPGAPVSPVAPGVSTSRAAGAQPTPILPAVRRAIAQDLD